MPVSSELYPVLSDDHFWRFLYSIEAIQEEKELKAFLLNLGVSEENFNIYANFLNSLDYDLRIERREGLEFLCPPSKKHKVQFDLNMIEWLSLQAHFPLFEQEGKHLFSQKISAKLSDLEKENSRIDLYTALEEACSKEKIIQELYADKKEMILFLEKTIPRNQVIEVTLFGGRKMEICIMKVLFLEGDLSLIGEGCSDRVLLSLPISSVESFQMFGANHYQKNFTKIQVEDFIKAIREVNGSGERLVLKILDGSTPNLEPRYQFLGSPFITKTPEGASIWAANVEVSEELFAWLYSMKNEVEIISPISLKQHFNKFCQEYTQEKSSQKRKLKKVA
jgi:hypothetical protein